MFPFAAQPGPAPLGHYPAGSGSSNNGTIQPLGIMPIHIDDIRDYGRMQPLGVMPIDIGDHGGRFEPLGIMPIDISDHPDHGDIQPLGIMPIDGQLRPLLTPPQPAKPGNDFMKLLVLLLVLLKAQHH